MGYIIIRSTVIAHLGPHPVLILDAWLDPIGKSFCFSRSCKITLYHHNNTPTMLLSVHGFDSKWEINRLTYLHSLLEAGLVLRGRDRPAKAKFLHYFSK